MYKLFIFDMDGTLVDSVDKWADLFERTLLKYHINVPREHLKGSFGREAPEIIRMLIPNGMAREATNFFMNHQKDYLSTFQAFPSAKRVFKDAKEKGHIVAVATGNTRRLMNFFLQKFELAQYVDFCICSEDVAHGKPDPEILLKTLKHFNIRPEDAFYIADSPMDFLAAKAAHIKIGLITTGVLCEKRARDLKPDYVFRDLIEVEKLI